MNWDCVKNNKNGDTREITSSSYLEFSDNKRKAWNNIVRLRKLMTQCRVILVQVIMESFRHEQYWKKTLNKNTSPNTWFICRSDSLFLFLHLLFSSYIDFIGEKSFLVLIPRNIWNNLIGRNHWIFSDASSLFATKRPSNSCQKGNDFCYLGKNAEY